MGRSKGSKNKLSKKIKGICLFCNSDFFSYPSRIKVGKGLYCSKECFNKSQIGISCSKETEFKKGIHYSIKTEFKKGDVGKLSKSWKGGISSCNGYIKIYNRYHPNNNRGYMLVHRLIAEKYIGRYLTNEETIHHINGIKDDNRIENLYLFNNNAEHARHHKNIQYKNIKDITKSNII